MSRSWLIVLVIGACSSRSAGDEARSRPAPAAAAAPTVRPAPVEDRYDSGALGAITFALSEGTPEARAHFTRGLLALHSFWYDEAIREFQAAIDADPTMNMAYWGAAMSRCKLLWGDDDLTAARELLARMPDPDRLPPREQAWVLAAVELIRDGDVRTSRKRFATAMESLHAQYPDDESATFLAAALLAAMRPDDPDRVAVRKRAAGLAAAVFAHNPKHPGAAHYLIHAYDTPELAAQALPYARAYAQIAPSAFHARHMPAHIFARLGMWKEAIASCQAAWDASVAAARAERRSADHHDFHSLSWLVEMNFELGQRAAADRALGVFGAAVRSGLGHQGRAQYANQVASYLVRTGGWARLDELLSPLDAPAVDDAPPAVATGSAARTGSDASHCAPLPAASPVAQLEQLAVLDARAWAAAGLHDVARTQRALREADAARDKLRSFLQATQPKDAIARIDAAHARHRELLLAYAGNNDRAVVDVLRRSLGDDEADGGESNPSGFIAHEALAEALLRLDRAKDAAAEYAVVLRGHPGRARSLLGAARAATRVGDATTARGWYDQLAQLWSGADPETEGLAEARAAITPGR